MDRPLTIRNRYRNWSRQAAVALLASLVAGAAAVVVPESVHIPTLIGATLVATVGFILGLSFWITAGVLDRELDAFRDGRWLGHWTVDLAEIAAFRARRRRDRRAIPWMVGGASGQAPSARLL